MGNLEIRNLKREYYNVVMNNQQTYNPDFNSVLDEQEIETLKIATGSKSVAELLSEDYKKSNIFYPYQTCNDITDKELKSSFRDLDLDNNGELSEEEISAYEDYLKLKYTNDNKHKELAPISKKANSPLRNGIISGTLSGLVGGTLLNKGMHRIYETAGYPQNKFARAFFKKVVEPVFCTGDSKNYCAGDHLYDEIYSKGTVLHKAIVIAAGLAVAGAVGYGIYKLCSKSSKVKEAQAEAAQRKAEMADEDAQVKSLDKQYQHVNATREAAIESQKRQGKNITEEELIGIGIMTMPFILGAASSED